MCTVAVIVSTLGYMPSPGMVIVIPQHVEQQASSAMKWQAKRCLSKYQIRSRIETALGERS